MYVYRVHRNSFYQVGFYDPTGTWVTENESFSSEEAIARVHYLNGGISHEQLSMVVDQLVSWLADICEVVKSLNPEVKYG